VTTLLNICACQSKLGKHQEALKFAEQSIKNLENFNQSAFAGILNPSSLEEGFENNMLHGQVRVKYWYLMRVAYQNGAIESDYMNEPTKAIHYYQMTIDVILNHLEPSAYEREIKGLGNSIKRV